MGKSIHVVFTGDKATQLAPESNKEAALEKGAGGIVREHKTGKQNVEGAGLK